MNTHTCYDLMSTFACAPVQILRCIRIAATKVEELTKWLREALDAHEVARIQRRVRRHSNTAAPASAAAAAARPVAVQ